MVDRVVAVVELEVRCKTVASHGGDTLVPPLPPPTERVIDMEQDHVSYAKTAGEYRRLAYKAETLLNAKGTKIEIDQNIARADVYATLALASIVDYQIEVIEKLDIAEILRPEQVNRKM